tara:strand:+ start:554 stop:790 length:237 start_codon:yes stop_codon:yes gene_type:complete
MKFIRGVFCLEPPTHCRVIICRFGLLYKDLFMGIIYFIQIVLLLPLLNGQEWTQTYGVNNILKSDGDDAIENFKEEND